MSSVCTVYQPQAIVCQCGADGLAGDPMGAFNLTEVSYSDCLHHILDLKLPTLVLGGGTATIVFYLVRHAECISYKMQ